MLHQHILLPSLFVNLTTRPTYTQVGRLGQGSSEKTQLPLPSEQVRLIHQFQKYRFPQKAEMVQTELMFDLRVLPPCLQLLSSPRPKRAGPKGPCAESTRAVTGRQCPHSGRGEDFLSRQPDFFTETAVTPDRKVEKSFPRWEINRHVEG